MIITKYSLYNFVRRHRINKVAFVSYGVAISLVIYFMMVSIFSNKGLIEYYTLKKQAQKIESEKMELQNKIRIKKDLIKGMNYESLDLDLVDEQSRKILGYVGKDELVIYQDQEHKTNKK